MKQGDAISPALFNAALDATVRKWKLYVTHHGLDIGAGKRLVDIRHADDLMVYTHAVDDSAQMIEMLIVEIDKMGLELT